MLYGLTRAHSIIRTIDMYVSLYLSVYLTPVHPVQSELGKCVSPQMLGKRTPTFYNVWGMPMYCMRHIG